MTIPKNSLPKQEISHLKTQTQQQQRSKFLGYLVTSLIVFLSIVVGLMLIATRPAWYWFITVPLSLALNIVVFYLNRTGQVKAASHLFCHNFNFLVGSAFLINLIIDQEETSAALRHFQDLN